jgi:hypothetical protein
MRPRAVVAISALTAGALGAVAASAPAGDSDTYWHLATARETIAHGLVRTDVFSWSAHGASVGTDQWLGQLLLYASYLSGGWLGVVALRAVIVSVLVFAIVAAALVRQPRSPIAAVALSIPAILLSRFLWTDRPELLGTACFALLVLLIQLPRRAIAAAAPLLILWANVHGSFALGAVLILLISAHALATRARPTWPYTVAAVGAVASFVLTPAGIATIGAPGLHLLHPPREIQEWAIPDPTTAAGLVWAVVLGAVLATAALAPRAAIRDAILIVPLAGLSLVAIRYAPLFAIASTPYLADQLPVAFARLAGPLAQGRSVVARTGRSAPPIIDIVLVLAGIALLAVGIAGAPGDVDEEGFPVDALAQLPAGPGLLNEYDWGGWLIWRAPATPVFVDGRLVPYLASGVMDDYRIVLEARPGWRDVVARRGIRYILVRPRDPVAVRARELGWTALVRSSSTVLISVPAGH